MLETNKIIGKTKGLKRDLPLLIKRKNRCNRITSTLNARSFMDQLNDVQIASERAIIKQLFDTNKIDAKPEDLKEIPASRRKNFSIGEWHLLRTELEERITQRKANRKKTEIQERQRKALLEKQDSIKKMWKHLKMRLNRMTNLTISVMLITLGIIHSLMCIMPVDTTNVLTGNIIGPLAAAGGVLGQSLLQFFGQKSQAEKQAESAAKTAEENLNLQKDAYAYQKSQNDLTRSREDNAVQRRAADLKAAGINPLLAAGSAVQANSASLPTAPQRENTNVAKYNMPDLLSVIQAFNQTAQTQSQVALAQAQRESTNQRLNFNSDLNPLLLESKLLGNIGQSSTNSRLQYALQADAIRNKILSNDKTVSDQETKEYMDILSKALREEERDFGRKSTSQASRELDMRYQDWLFLSSKGGPAAFAAKQKTLDSMLGLLNNFLPSLSPMGAGSRKVPARIQNIHNYNY